MSYHSVHMKNQLSGKVRAGVEVMSLDEVLDIPLDELKKLNTQLYGNTKWPDITFLVFYYEFDGNKNQAALALGTSHTNFCERLSKVNTIEHMMVYEAVEKRKKKANKNAYAPDIKKMAGRKMTPELFRMAFMAMSGNRARIIKALKISERQFYYWKKRLAL